MHGCAFDAAFFRDFDDFARHATDISRVVSRCTIAAYGIASSVRRLKGIHAQAAFISSYRVNVIRRLDSDTNARGTTSIQEGRG